MAVLLLRVCPLLSGRPAWGTALEPCLPRAGSARGAAEAQGWSHTEQPLPRISAQKQSKPGLRMEGERPKGVLGNVSELGGFLEKGMPPADPQPLRPGPWWTEAARLLGAAVGLVCSPPRPSPLAHHTQSPSFSTLALGRQPAWAARPSLSQPRESTHSAWPESSVPSGSGHSRPGAPHEG